MKRVAGKVSIAASMILFVAWFLSLLTPLLDTTSVRLDGGTMEMKWGALSPGWAPSAVSRSIIIPTYSSSHVSVGTVGRPVRAPRSHYIMIPLLGPALSLLLLGVLLLARLHRNSGECSKCGDCLTGNISGRCPECGAPHRESGQG
jgi:hypothetical protein